MSSEVSQQVRQRRDRRVRSLRWLLGFSFLGTSLAVSGMLAVQHLGHLELPGCGPQSGCAALAASQWGNVLGWPVAFLGSAYFAGLLVTWLWIGQSRGISGWLRWGVRLSVLGSVAFTAVMIAEGHFCQYCVAVHAGNLAFWLVVERARRAAAAPRLLPAVVGAIVFAAVSGVLANVQAKVKDAAADRSEKAFQESLARIVEHVRKPGPFNDAPKTSQFTGRYRLGPERAAIRLVVFTDYQCKDCIESEHQIEELLRRRDDVSFSHKQFPLCQDCNRMVKGPFHDNACRAALASEAAGILGGNDGFWRMHRWLIEQKGKFTQPELRTALPELGFADTRTFLHTMDDPKTMQRVKTDIEEGIRLGLNWTPMILINGVELRGNDAPRAVQRAVAAVAKENPAARTAAADRPIPADEKFLEEWLSAEPLKFRERRARWTVGPADARTRVILTVCHQNPYAPAVSRAVREVVKRRGDVRLEFWHFPISKQHNPKFENMKDDRYPDSYRMAKIAEAAGRIGGNDAFWKMHDWLLDHQEGFAIESALGAACAIGLDRDQFAAELESDGVRESLREDMAKGIRAGLRWAPGVFVDHREMASWGAPTPQLLERTLDCAVQGASTDSNAVAHVIRAD